MIPSLSTDGARSQSRGGLAAFPTPALPGFCPPDWRSGFGGTMRPSDSLKSFASLAYSTCRAYSVEHDWSSCFNQELQGLTGCLFDTMCNANGPPTPGLLTPLAKSRCEVLPSGMNRPWADSERYKISGLIPFMAAGPPTVHSSSLPFYVRFKLRFQSSDLIRNLQHSIRGPWLTLTSAGFTPASQSDLPSPHVQRIVIRRLVMIVFRSHHWDVRCIGFRLT